MIGPEQLMRLAIAKAREGIGRGQSPFGCAVAVGDDILAVCHNTVLATIDVTAHAEINALREACHRVGDIFLSDAVVATTCEPCPMCAAALHWARVGTVYYGAVIGDAEKAGFNELSLSAGDVVRSGGGQVQLAGGVLTADCQALFDEWKAQPGSRTY